MLRRRRVQEKQTLLNKQLICRSLPTVTRSVIRLSTVPNRPREVPLSFNKCLNYLNGVIP